MKIAYLIERLNPSRGGAEQYAWDFTARLAASGHEVTAFAGERSSAPPGVTLRPVRGSGASFSAAVERELAGAPFNVVHGTGWTWSGNVFQPHGGVHLANREARQMSRFWDAVLPKQRRMRRIERKQYFEHPPVLFVAVSGMVQRDMQRFYGIAAEKIRVVYDGVDVERFTPTNRGKLRAETRKTLGIREEEVVFLIVAHNFELKGVPDLIACASAAEFPPCRVVVVGKDARPSSSGRVIYAGPVEDPEPYYAAADVYAHPTHYDTCSLTVLEAMASGLPVVTTTMSGVAEIVADGREGFVIPARDAGALDAALRKLFDAALRVKMGAAARALAEKHTLGDNVRDMVAVYAEAIRLKGRS